MNNNVKDTVYLVDGSGYIFRAYYALPSLSTSYGFPTNALFAFTKMFLKLLAQAENIVVCFDVSKETFRKELYPEYKANRQACPDDLVPQLPYFRSICVALGVAVAEKEGFEADDVIGTLTKRFLAAGLKVVIVSGDKDLMQLVTDNVQIWDTMKDIHYSIDGVIKKWGVPPNLIADLLGLMGDSSDNIPGLSGVGPKTAVQLLESYGSVEQVLAAADKIVENKAIRGRVKIAAQLDAEREIVLLSKKLATIDCNCSVDIWNADKRIQGDLVSDYELLTAIKKQTPISSQLQELVEQFEFSSLFQGFNFEPPQELSNNLGHYQYINESDFPAWLENFNQQKAFSLFINTSNNDMSLLPIYHIAFAWNDEEAYYLDCDETLLRKLTPQLENENVKKYGHDLKNVIRILAEFGIELKGIANDTMLASYLLNPDGMEHSLTSLAKRYLGFIIDFSNFEGDKLAEAALAIWLLNAGISGMLANYQLDKLMSEVEMPLIPTLASMEQVGIKLDVDTLHEMSKTFDKRLATLRESIFLEAGVEFNLNSPKQLADILFNKLAIPTTGLKKTKTGYSTDSSVLETLSYQHVLPRYLLEYRAIFKLKSTYVDTLPQLVDERGRIHTTFNQMVTGTGRLSSSEPNLQNIPIQTAEGREIRKAFVSERGKVLISADYSQIELRVLAHLSQDKNLIQAFNEDIDIHAQAARKLLGINPEDNVSAEQRRIGKTINFGVIYGMSAFRLGQDLGLPVYQAKRYIEDYFEYYSGVKEFFNTVEVGAERNGYVTTMFGRRRVISDIDKTGHNKDFLRRVAINAPIQGTAADIIKLAMIKVSKALIDAALPVTMLLQIHDELLFECDESSLDSALEVIKQHMENVVELRVPLRISIGCGHNWLEAH